MDFDHQERYHARDQMSTTYDVFVINITEKHQIRGQYPILASYIVDSEMAQTIASLCYNMLLLRRFAIINGKTSLKNVNS